MGSFIETLNAKLLAAASKDQEKSKKFKDQFNIESKYLFNSYEELINCEDVDIVYIALPNFLHHEWALKSIKNKKHILVEKPLISNSLKILNNLKKAIKKKKIIFYTAYNHRFEPNIVEMKKLIKSKKLGKIYTCKIWEPMVTLQSRYDILKIYYKDQLFL